MKAVLTGHPPAGAGVIAYFFAKGDFTVADRFPDGAAQGGVRFKEFLKQIGRELILNGKRIGFSKNRTLANNSKRGCLNRTQQPAA